MPKSIKKHLKLYLLCISGLLTLIGFGEVLSKVFSWVPSILDIVIACIPYRAFLLITLGASILLLLILSWFIPEYIWNCYLLFQQSLLFCFLLGYL